MTQSLGVGAQFGGKYFCHDVRVIRLPRHGASLPIGLGRVVLGRPPGDGQDHQGRRVPRRARAQSGEVSAGGGHVEARRRGGEDRPQQADEGHSGAAHEVSDQDAAVAHRPDDRGARPRARETARAAGAGAGAARLFQEPSGVLRRAGEDAGGLRLRRVRPDHGGADGFVRRRFPEGRRLDGDAGEGQPLAGGDGGVQAVRRLLSRLDRRRGGEPRRALHQEGRDASNIPNSAWRRSGGSRWSISRPSSSSTTRATTSSRN